MQTATLIINQETLRQTLRVEREHWAKLKQYFNFNHELVQNIANEQVLNIGCFSGLLSFINCGNLYKHEDVVKFIGYERDSFRAYEHTVSNIADQSKLTRKELESLISYHLRRTYFVELFVKAIISSIEGV